MVWSQASILDRKDKIKKQIEELRENIYEDVNWTRKKVLANINYAITNNKLNIENKKQIYEEMIQDKYKELMQWVALKLSRKYRYKMG